MPKSSAKLGLALGGGGARGLAHIGVLQALEEAEIPIGCLSGTSMGGLIAAGYAAGHSAAQLEQEALRMTSFGELLQLLDWSIPKDGLLGGSNVEGYLKQLLGEGLAFSDLRIPLALSAVDLRTGEAVALQEGSVVQAVRATIALPGVFEPAEMGERRLVDGGVLNNVPADLVRELGAEVVVAVDVSLDIHDDAAWEKVDLPPLLRTLWRADAITVAALTAARLDRVDPQVILRPQVRSEVATLSGFKHAEDVIAAGRDAAEQALPQIRALLQGEGR
ncbi:MAG: patatin-like phospholipase family protein [Chloroflexia bacterium]|nr:patatin-like phospholipase family protein [Chloroflexia bacterium]